MKGQTWGNWRSRYHDRASQCCGINNKYLYAYIRSWLGKKISLYR